MSWSWDLKLTSCIWPSHVIYLLHTKYNSITWLNITLDFNRVLDQILNFNQILAYHQILIFILITAIFHTYLFYLTLQSHCLCLSFMMSGPTCNLRLVGVIAMPFLGDKVSLLLKALTYLKSCLKKFSTC